MLRGTSTETLVVLDVSAPSAVVVWTDFFRPLVALVESVFSGVPFTEVLVFFTGLRGGPAAFLTADEVPLRELRVDLGVGVVAASEVRLGLDEEAVLSTAFFCRLVEVGAVVSAAPVALRFAGAISSEC